MNGIALPLEIMVPVGELTSIVEEVPNEVAVPSLAGLHPQKRNKSKARDEIQRSRQGPHARNGVLLLGQEDSVTQLTRSSGVHPS